MGKCYQECESSCFYKLMKCQINAYLMYLGFNIDNENIESIHGLACMYCASPLCTHNLSYPGLITLYMYILGSVSSELKSSLFCSRTYWDVLANESENGLNVRLDVVTDPSIRNCIGPSFCVIVKSPWPDTAGVPTAGQLELLLEQTYISETHSVVGSISVPIIPICLASSLGQFVLVEVTVLPAAQKSPSGVVIVNLFSVNTEF